MGKVVALPPRTTSERELPLQLLLADDVARMRSLLASCAREAIDGLVVIEAADGAEAIQRALQRRPQFALLDVNMRPLGGIEAALTLRELLPDIRLALQTNNPYAHRGLAREHRLPLFDKGDFDHALAWILSQVRWPAGRRSEAELTR